MEVSAAPSRGLLREVVQERAVNASESMLCGAGVRKEAQGEVFDMLAKAGCTMWSSCQGVKSGRFAQYDRPLDGCWQHEPVQTAWRRYLPGTERPGQTLSVQTLTRSPLRLRHDLHPHNMLTVPVGLNADSQCERQVCRQRPIQSAPRALCRRIWNGGSLLERYGHSKTRCLLAGPSLVRAQGRDGRRSRERLRNAETEVCSSQSDPRASHKTKLCRLGFNRPASLFVTLPS